MDGLVINRCPLSGILISSSSATTNTISGNYIGTDALGSSDLGNSWYGVYIQSGAQNNVIGGHTSGERNIISGNHFSGVLLWDSGTMSNTISGNYTGTDLTGTQDLGNTQSGVYIGGGAQNNVIGGETEGESNIIAFNHGIDPFDGGSLPGVMVDNASTTGNTITRNSIHSNAGLGIALIDGANGNIPAPTISAANTCFVIGTAGASNTVEIFTGPDEEGKTYLTTVSADGNGNWNASDSFTLDTYVTATATDASGNTSEFSTQATPGTCYQIFLPLIMKNY